MKSRRRMSEPAKRASRWITWTLATSVGIAAGFFGWHQLVARVAPERAIVSALEISGNRRVTPEELAERVALPPRTFLGEINLQEIETRVEEHPWIARARVTALPPGRLLIGVEERTARATARLGDALHYVDGSGIPFAAAPRRPAVPELAGADDLELGAPSPILVSGIQILDSLEREELPAPARIVVAGPETGEHPSFEWVSGESTQRIVIGQGQVADKIRRLGRLIRRHLPEVTNATSLDLRFSERAILRAPIEADPDSDDAPGSQAGNIELNPREERGA